MGACARVMEKGVKNQLSRQEKYSFPLSILSPPWLLTPLNHKVYPCLSHGLINVEGNQVGGKKIHKCPETGVHAAGTIHVRLAAVHALVREPHRCSSGMI